ncbi:MAG: hypothetical protein P4L67_04410 [Candidatus Pacebacteria bacterium]|nr:hypothetical protein [Candidatus Paceibacterota bacterium]
MSDNANSKFWNRGHRAFDRLAAQARLLVPNLDRASGSPTSEAIEKIGATIGEIEARLTEAKAFHAILKTKSDLKPQARLKDFHPGVLDSAFAIFASTVDNKGDEAIQAAEAKFKDEWRKAKAEEDSK